jgi:hypothetical protein
VSNKQRRKRRMNTQKKQPKRGWSDIMVVTKNIFKKKKKPKDKEEGKTDGDSVKTVKSD